MEIPTTPSIAANRPAPEHRKGGIDWPIFWISGGFFLLFLIAALVNLGWLSSVVDTAFGWATRGFGLYWQVLMLATFAVSLGIAFSKLGRVKLGGIGQVPSNSTFNWRVLGGGRAFDAFRQSAAFLWSRGQDVCSRRCGALAIVPSLGLSRMGGTR